MSATRLLARTGELIRSQWLLFAALAIWAFAPFVAQFAHVIRYGGVLTGTGGADLFDQFQYLAWIRDEGTHVLASNLWVTTPTPHDYLHPMYLISGLLWRAGASVQLAYLIWKPVAVLVLFLGCCAYMRRLLPGSRWQQAAALALALFYETPALALASWIGHLPGPHRFALALASDDANAALNLWGFDHAAIAIGLMPVFLIATEQLLAARAFTRRWTAVASVSGLLVSWLHPWQGVILLGAVGGLFLLAPPRRRFIALIGPVAATVVPLLYGLALTRWDHSWHVFQVESTTTGTAPWWALLASLAPLGAFALAGRRRPGGDREWLLVLWLAASAAVYFLVPEFPPHALAGVTVPLAVLGVRGFVRVFVRVSRAARLPRVAATLTGAAAVAAVTIPAAVDHAQGVHDQLARTSAGAFSLQQLRLTDDQAAALRYLEHSARRGSVLAPWLLSLSVPAFTGRQVYAGHLQWQPQQNTAAANRFFDPALSDATRRREILRASATTFVVAGCLAPPELGRQIAALARPVRRFGCVTVYERGAAGR